MRPLDGCAPQRFYSPIEPLRDPAYRRASHALTQQCFSHVAHLALRHTAHVGLHHERKENVVFTRPARRRQDTPGDQSGHRRGRERAQGLPRPPSAPRAQVIGSRNCPSRFRNSLIARLSARSLTSIRSRSSWWLRVGVFAYPSSNRPGTPGAIALFFLLLSGHLQLAVGTASESRPGERERGSSKCAGSWG